MRSLLPFAIVAWLTVPVAAQSCADRLDFFTKLINRDLKTGFVGKTVHAKMTNELMAAQSACGAGNDRKAQAMISASQSRHGYPVR